MTYSISVYLQADGDTFYKKCIYYIQKKMIVSLSRLFAKHKMQFYLTMRQLQQ